MRRMEQTVKQTAEDLDLNAFCPKNSSISDFRRTFLKKVSKLILDSSTDIHKELVCKFDLCDKLLNIYLKREILTKLSRVRYKMSNELWDVRVKTDEMKLTPKMKSFLQVISQRGFEFLEKEEIFQDFVEIDNSSELNVLHKGKLHKLCIDLDVICPMPNQEEIKPDTSSVGKKSENNCKLSLKNTESMTTKHNYEDLPLLERPPKGILKRTKNVEYSVSTELNMPQNVIELDSDSDEEEDKENEDLERDQAYDTLILNFVLSTRRSIPANTVLKQFLSKLVFPRQKNLVMVFHVGTLIKDQEIVLYEYICNKDLLKLNQDRLVTTEDISKQHNINISSNRLYSTADIHLQNHDSLESLQKCPIKEICTKPRNLDPEEDQRLFSSVGKDVTSELSNKHYINIDPFVSNWTENEHRLVHTFSDSRDSVKDSIFEYQGLGKLQNPKLRAKKKLHKAKEAKETLEKKDGKEMTEKKEENSIKRGPLRNTGCKQMENGS